MTAAPSVVARHWPIIDIREPRPPGWVTSLPGLERVRPVPLGHDFLELGLARGRELSRVAASIGGVHAMDILTFQQAVAEAYRAVFDQLATLETPHPVRFWAMVPDIHEDMGAGLDRYMAFNAGRFAAYSARCGGRDALGQSVATGSAVGIRGDRLHLHCLASSVPGVPVENPRQIPAYRYSRHYGPLPPCFARATAVSGGPWGEAVQLLVGGTASIRGEESLHAGDVRQQTAETLQNLTSLARSAAGAGPDEDGAPGWLSRFRELRVYRPRVADTDAILDTLLREFTGVSGVEVLEAELCRAELLVELEGVVDLGPTDRPRA
jgi:chorismate lyase/3-hydroxybenzoate synthase